MAEPTDEELMARFCRGDEAAFDALYARYAPPLQARLLRLLRSRELAEDVLQMTFLSIVRSRDRFDPGARFAPWVHTIATNAARDALRRRVRAREDDLPVDELEAEPGPAASDAALGRTLEAALAELPDAQRDAVVAHHVLGWSFEELAAARGTTAVTMRVRAHRGFEKLREKLKHLLEAKP